MYPGGPSSGNHIGPYGAAVIISGAMFSGRRESSVKYAMIFALIIKAARLFNGKQAVFFNQPVDLRYWIVSPD
jgi:hypothetical protein